MSRVVHFEIHAGDPERAVGFYTKILGWKFERWGTEEYWLITTGPDSQPGINGGFYAKDTEGNIFGVTQPDPNAA